MAVRARVGQRPSQAERPLIGKRSAAGRLSLSLSTRDNGARLHVPIGIDRHAHFNLGGKCVSTDATQKIFMGMFIVISGVIKIIN